MIPQVSMLLSVLLAGAGAGAQCPDTVAPDTSAFSEAAGCVWADADEGHRFDSREQALGRCRSVGTLSEAKNEAAGVQGSVRAGGSPDGDPERG